MTQNRHMEEAAANAGRALNDLAAALEAVGGQAETNAKNNLTAASKVDTDNLRGSITHDMTQGQKPARFLKNLCPSLFYAIQKKSTPFPMYPAIRFAL